MDFVRERRANPGETIMVFGWLFPDDDPDDYPDSCCANHHFDWDNPTQKAADFKVEFTPHGRFYLQQHRLTYCEHENCKERKSKYVPVAKGDSDDEEPQEILDAIREVMD